MKEKKETKKKKKSTTRIKRGGGKKVRGELEDRAEGAGVRMWRRKVERGGQTALFSRGKDESEAQPRGPERKKEERKVRMGPRRARAAGKEINCRGDKCHRDRPLIYYGDRN